MVVNLLQTNAQRSLAAAHAVRRQVCSNNTTKAGIIEQVREQCERVRSVVAIRRALDCKKKGLATNR
jgi:hypothetical protein